MGRLCAAVFRIAETYPNDPAAIDALIWIASHDMFGSDGEKALKILTRNMPAALKSSIMLRRISAMAEPFSSLRRAAADRFQEGTQPGCPGSNRRDSGDLSQDV